MTALVILFPLMLACIVLKPNEIDTTNDPPTLSIPIDAPSDRRADRIVDFDLDDGEQNLVLQVNVRDPDDEPIEGRIFVDDTPMPSRYRGNPFLWAPLPGHRMREVDIRLDSSFFDPGKCYRVELLASREFVTVADAGAGDERLPAREGDLTSMIWWVLVTDATHPLASISACP